jgi:hypothetical protein
MFGKQINGAVIAFCFILLFNGQSFADETCICAPDSHIIADRIFKFTDDADGLDRVYSFGVMEAGAAQIPAVSELSGAFSYDESRIFRSCNLFAGCKLLDVEWIPVDFQTEVGAMLDIPINEGVNFAGYLLTSSGTGTDWDVSLGDMDVTGSTTEINLGVRIVGAPPQNPNIKGFVGLGLSYVMADMTVATTSGTVSDSWSAVGLWYDAGFAVVTPGGFTIGMDILISMALTDVGGQTVDLGGAHVGFLFGYSW